METRSSIHLTGAMEQIQQQAWLTQEQKQAHLIDGLEQERTGTYLVKAMATNSKGATSAWSSTLSVKISTTRHAPEEAQGQELKGGA